MVAEPVSVNQAVFSILKRLLHFFIHTFTVLLKVWNLLEFYYFFFEDEVPEWQQPFSKISDRYGSTYLGWKYIEFERI